MSPTNGLAVDMPLPALMYIDPDEGEDREAVPTDVPSIYAVIVVPSYVKA